MSGLVKPQLLISKTHTSDILPSGVRDIHDRDNSLSKLNLHLLDTWIPKLEFDHGVKILRWVLARSIEEEAVFSHYFSQAFYSPQSSQSGLSSTSENGSSSERLGIFYLILSFSFSISQD